MKKYLGLVLTLGVVVPRLFGIGHTLLTAPSSVMSSKPLAS